jgi:hypothetical protein
MRTREVTVTGRSVQSAGENSLIRTSIGIDQMHVLFDNPEWLGFSRVVATFANGDTMIAVNLNPTTLESVDWAAEATCIIPWEVMQDVGSVELTFHAIDNSTGVHIVTQKNTSVFSVIQEGDVDPSTLPAPYPTPPALPIATLDEPGAVMPDGTTITIDQDGTIHGASTYELPPATTSSLGGVIPDGTTITVDADGTIHGATNVDIGEITAAEIHAITGNSATYAYDGEGVGF